MSSRTARAAGTAALAVVAACSRNPKPMAAAPAAPAADAGLAARMRQDSLLALARADSIAKAGRAASHADSVRAQVMREAAEADAGTGTGLPGADGALLAEPLHFDYNVADLTPADVRLLEQKLGLLASHARVVVQIAGNADERGSDEYNLALGERRAAAAKRWLTEHGVAADRISVVSYGEERPLDPGHDEEAWSKNRRDDFVVKGTVE